MGLCQLRLFSTPTAAVCLSVSLYIAQFIPTLHIVAGENDRVAALLDLRAPMMYEAAIVVHAFAIPFLSFAFAIAHARISPSSDNV